MSEKFADQLGELIIKFKEMGLDRDQILTELEVRLYAEREEEEG